MHVRLCVAINKHAYTFFDCVANSFEKRRKNVEKVKEIVAVMQKHKVGYSMRNNTFMS